MNTHLKALASVVFGAILATAFSVWATQSPDSNSSLTRGFSKLNSSAGSGDLLINLGYYDPSSTTWKRFTGNVTTCNTSTINQRTISTSTAVPAAVTSGRTQIAITNQSGSVSVYCSHTDPTTTTNGILISALGTRTFGAVSAVYCVTADASTVILGYEECGP